ncbi:muconate cycloisomerase [Pusillimonas sp. TS35]|nr:muconate cycloisomerase [Pusillimonas sp. TS35]
MKATIISVSTHILDIPTIRPHKLSVATMEHQSMVLVRIKNSDGLEGIGEATTIGGLNYGAESPESIKANIDTYFAPVLVGSPSYNPAALRNRLDKVVKANHFAKSAVETALYDLLGKRLGVPVSTLLGGAVHEKLDVAWTLASGDTQRDIAEARQLLERRRHTIFKLKIGLRPLREDIEHCAAIKAALGDDVSVRVDVNQGWTETQAQQALRPMANAGIDLIEQPIAEKNLNGMRRLTALGILPIMADEALKGPEDGLTLATGECANVYAIKIEQAGGLRAAQKLIGIAQAAGITLYGGTMLEGPISTIASAHVFATVNSFEWGTELFGPLLMKDSILTEPLDYSEFTLTLPRNPGLGIALDEDKVKHYLRG